MKINSEESEGTLILKTVTYRFDIETFCVFIVISIVHLCFLSVFELVIFQIVMEVRGFEKWKMLFISQHVGFM